MQDLDGGMGAEKNWRLPVSFENMLDWCLFFFFFFFKKAEQLHFSSVDLNRCLFEMPLNVWGI